MRTLARGRQHQGEFLGRGEKARMSHLSQQELKRESKHGCRKSGLVFVELMMLSVQHKSGFFKSQDSRLFRARGGFSALIRGLFELINRQSSFDQRMAMHAGREQRRECRINERKTLNL